MLRLVLEPSPRWHRLRAAAPTVIGGLCQAADIPGGWALVAVGLLGSVMVWREDGRAPVAAWRARFPDAPLHQVRRLPPPGPRAVSFGAVCADVELAQRALEHARRVGAAADQPRLHALGHELAGLVGLAADVCCQLSLLDEIPGAAPERVAHLERTLHAVAPAARELRAALLRVGAAGASAHGASLSSIVSRERDLTAMQDCRDELEVLP